MITRVHYEVISDACIEWINCFSRASIGRINSYPMRIWRMLCLFTIPWPSEPQTTANGQTCFTSGPLTGESTSFRPREWENTLYLFRKMCHSHQNIITPLLKQFSLFRLMLILHLLPSNLLLNSPSYQFPTDIVKSRPTFIMF